jgi:unsaturated chondroitin disaccharide hydrolase
MSATDSTEDFEEAIGLAADGTLAHLRRLMPKDYAGYIGGVNKWTGRYERSDRYVLNQIGWLLGRLWVLFAYTGDEEFRHFAERILRPMLPDLVEKPIQSLGSGIALYFGLCLGAEVTGAEALHDCARRANQNLVASLWSEKLGRFRAFQHLGDNFVPVEFGGNLRPLIWSSRETPAYLDQVVSHMEDVLALGLVRADGSTNHLAFLDAEGRVERYETQQGWRADSTWARGQSWTMYSLILAAQASQRPSLQAAARKVTGWWLDHLPDDLVPYYDFDDPERELGPRDSCAAGMGLSALMYLNADPAEASDRSRAVADATLVELCRNYLSIGGVLLHGSMGNVAGHYGGQTTRKPPGHGEANARNVRFPQEEVLPWGNYFIVEALYRKLRGEAAFPPLLAK